VAIGFNIIYCTTGIINFAQGEFLIVGAMTAISLAQVLPLPVAILLAVLITTLLGGLLELVFIRQIRNPSVVRLVIITIGLSILIREAMLHIWDEKPWSLPYFTGTASSTIKILGAYIPPQVLWVLGVSPVIVAGLPRFVRYRLRRLAHPADPVRHGRPAGHQGLHRRHRRRTGQQHGRRGGRPVPRSAGGLRD
jgi:branched-chain amino acid transport system permease protein